MSWLLTYYRKRDTSRLELLTRALAAPGEVLEMAGFLSTAEDPVPNLREVLSQDIFVWRHQGKVIAIELERFLEKGGVASLHIPQELSAILIPNLSRIEHLTGKDWSQLDPDSIAISMPYS